MVVVKSQLKLSKEKSAMSPAKVSPNTHDSHVKLPNYNIIVGSKDLNAAVNV